MPRIRQVGLIASVAGSILFGLLQPSGVLADTTAPAAPTGMTVVPSMGWQSSADFAISWVNPGIEHGDIAAAHYELCRGMPLGPCTTHVVNGLDVSSLDLSLPGPGWYTLRVWLEDGAGNIDVDHVSSPVSMRFDNQVPAAPALDAASGWLRGAGPITVPTGLAGLLPPPLSGIAGYSYTLSGEVPDLDVDALADQDFDQYRATLVLDDLEEGTTTISARSVSGAGVGSIGVGQAVVRIDRSPPDVELRGGGDQAAWRTQPVSFDLVATDQAHLSGMTPAPSGEPAESGGHVRWTAQGVTHTSRGAVGSATLDTDGHHTLRFKAVDVAGNESVEKQVSFKIDRTAPVGQFRAADVEDPALLVADVRDATSGIADGWIEYRPPSGGQFRRLPSHLSDGVLAARMPDGELPDGRYAVRAVVIDVAGNRAAVDTRVDGAAMAVALPLRAPVTLRAKARAVGGEACRSKNRGKGSRRERACRPVGPARKLTIPQGRRLVVQGVLRGGDGPLAGMTLLVEARTAGHSDFVPLGTTVTDGRGRFRRPIPAGPSRTVRLRFVGTNRLGAATASLATEVRAPVRLRVDRRRLLNGQSVRFRGRLPGKPIPTSGKLVALQAKVPGGWRTFATPRTNARGVFKHRYRFTSTTGLRRYRFRAVVEAEPAYPYARGLSRTVNVTVRGR